MMSELRRKARVALVFGGSRGIGRATSIALARSGFEVIIAARGTAACVNHVTVTSEIKKMGAKGHFLPVNIQSSSSIANMYTEMKVFVSNLDVLVYSVGDAMLGGLADTSPEEFQHIWDLNLGGAYRAIYHAQPFFSEYGGDIILIVSRAGRHPYANALAYGSAKAGLVYLIRALSLDLYNKGIRVNGVSPGAVATELRKRVVPDEDVSLLMPPEHVAQVVMSLLRVEMAGVTGSIIDVPW